jgi:hypothetical protein
MASSIMLRRVALVRTRVSEELSASFIRVTIICELGTTLAVTTIATDAAADEPESDEIIYISSLITTGEFTYCMEIVHSCYHVL